MMFGGIATVVVGLGTLWLDSVGLGTGIQLFLWRIVHHGLETTLFSGGLVISTVGTLVSTGALKSKAWMFLFMD